ncbi:MAG: Arc family DNA-binding protein [Deltaproteobacteria bacterium]|nr:Arc family DNA-binding protein [Deltaproteobacteria bacterium]
MRSLQIRELPDEIYTKLKIRAQSEHRSLAQEAIAILERSLAIEPMARQRRAAILYSAQQQPIKLPTNAPRPEELIRADRER